MALEIKEQHGIFELHGTLSPGQLSAVRSYFLYLFETQDALVVDLEHLSGTDAGTIRFLNELGETATESGCAFSVLAGKNGELASVWARLDPRYAC